MSTGKATFTVLDLMRYMQEAIDRVIEDTADVERATFMAPTPDARRRRDAVVLNIGHMGEIANDLRRAHPDYVEAHPELPVAVIYDMRNQLFHGYHAIDFDIVWATAKRHIPMLRDHVQACLEELERAERHDDGGAPPSPST